MSKTADENTNDFTTVRIDKDIAERVRKIGRANRRSLQQEANALLDNAVKAEKQRLQEGSE